MSKYFRDPAFHFLVLALGLFALFYAAPRDVAPAREARNFDIQLTKSDANRLKQSFAATWQRNPTSLELNSFLEESVRNQIIVREARSLGLDISDSAIDARLVQKMRYLTDSFVHELSPSEAILQSFFDAEKERFTVSATKGFEQVYLGDRVSQATVDATLAALNSGQAAQGLGVSTMLPAVVTDAIETRVDGQFGSGFFAALAELEDDKWGGPIQSGFGFHLVKTSQGTPAFIPPLEDIRQDVLADWKREKSSELAQAQFEKIKAKYTITIPTSEELDEVLRK